MSVPHADYLENLPATYDPSTPLFRSLARTARAIRSKKFLLLFADAGLATAPNQQSTGKGRHAARPVSELSFHSLRQAVV